jgi:pyruvate/2-oxoglutarate/acetoin dehydrogenase E1 component
LDRKITFVKAINEALFQAMEMDDSVICYGLGVPDPKGVFGTTLGLQERFGTERVFDMPASENAMTGVAIGASLNGIRPVMTHQRVDFFLLAMDQLINNAAKWHYMFGGKISVPITIRLIIGRGWGQGPTHSQNLHAWFAHIPGLKVVVPATATDAKGLLLSSIFDENPVIFLEHRWLHNFEGPVPENDFRIPIGKAEILKSGKDISIIAFSHMAIEALHAVKFLENEGVMCDLINLRSIKPIDWELIFQSVQKTGRLLALDTGALTISIASEIVAVITTKCFDNLIQAPQRLAQPDVPTPTSPALTKDFYSGAADIVDMVGRMLGKSFNSSILRQQQNYPHDVPGDWYNGPF